MTAVWRGWGGHCQAEPLPGLGAGGGGGASCQPLLLNTLTSL